MAGPAPTASALQVNASFYFTAAALERLSQSPPDRLDRGEENQIVTSFTVRKGQINDYQGPGEVVKVPYDRENRQEVLESVCSPLRTIKENQNPFQIKAIILDSQEFELGLDIQVKTLESGNTLSCLKAFTWKFNREDFRTRHPLAFQVDKVANEYTVQLFNPTQ